jgi:hypothetical protein
MTMNPNDQNKASDAAETARARRRPYVTPTLTQLGSIEDLTRGNPAGRSPDGRFFRFKN